jgi:hypothetical protein
VVDGEGRTSEEGVFTKAITTGDAAVITAMGCWEKWLR